MKNIKKWLITICMFIAVMCFGFAIPSFVNVQTASAESTNNFYIEGAGVRIIDDEKGGGIRFALMMSETYFDKKVEGKDNVSLGALIVPTDLLPADMDFERAINYVEGSKIKNVELPANYWTADKDNEGYLESYVCIYNIPQESYNRNLTCVGYITINGDTQYTSPCVRSFTYVADKAIKDPNSDLSDEQKEYVSRYLTTETVTVQNQFGNYEISVKYGQTLSDVIYADDNCKIPEGYDYATYILGNGEEYDINEEVLTDLTVKQTFWKGISTLEELRAITNTNDNYVLLNDIDAGNATYSNTTFLGDFAGVLEGNGYSIKNVKIQAANQWWGSGLFGTLSGTVRNIGFENITMLGGTSNYLGKSGFIAQNLTGKAINIYLTGTVSGVVYSSSTPANRYGIVAHDATGGTAYNIRAHIDGMVSGSSALTAAMAPTHWGNFYASYTGTVSAWHGTKVARDLGGQCLETSKESGDAAAISQTFNNTYGAALEADVAPYITNDYWNMTSVELKELDAKMATVKKVEYYFENNGVYELIDALTEKVYIKKTDTVSVVAPHFDGYAFNEKESVVSLAYDPNGVTLKLYYDKFLDTYTAEDGTVYTKISTLAQLRAITGTDGNYILVNDIDAGNATYSNTSFLGDFAGVLEGNGYSIKNVKIQAANQYWGSGLFGTLSGTVRNIGFENITMLGGAGNYLGKSGFIAQNLTGKAINIYLTGTVSGVVYTAGGKSYYYGIAAYDATGGTAYNIRAHIDGMVAGSNVVTGAMAPTHWGNFYASYTGAVSGWYGTKVARDLGGQCLESSKESGDASAISQTFNNTYGAALEADVAPYITNDYWDMTTATLNKGNVNLQTYTAEDGTVYTKISTLAQLRAITGTDGNYILVNDIDAGNATYSNTTFLGDFAGVLEGNGYSIKNVKIQAANQWWGSGLFGTLSGTVRNIGFENITMLGGASNYLGKSGFIAQNLTGKAINIYLTGTVSGVVYSSSTAANRYGIVAHDATGGTAYNIRAHIDGMVSGSSALTAAMAPTHWGNFYASYTGTVSAWYGTKVARDLGGQCLESSKESGDASAISQTFNNTYGAALEADVAPYITNDYWDMTTATLKKNCCNVSDKVEEVEKVTYYAQYYFENADGEFVLNGELTTSGEVDKDSKVTVLAPAYNGYVLTTDTVLVKTIGVDGMAVKVYYELDRSAVGYSVEYYYQQTDGSYVLDSTLTGNYTAAYGTILNIAACAESVKEGYFYDSDNDYEVNGFALTFTENTVKIYYKLETVTLTIYDKATNEMIYQGEVIKGTSFDITRSDILYQYDVVILETEDGTLINGEMLEEDTVVYASYGEGIDTVAEFMAIDSDTDYVLMNDIDFMGAELAPIEVFSGVLNGNGFSLKNFTIKRTMENGNGGIFTQMNGAIRNLGIENVTFAGVGESGYEYVGQSGILAYKLGGTVENVTIQGQVTANVRGKSGTADYTSANWYFGLVAYDVSGATLNNIIVDVELQSAERVNLVAGTTSGAKYTLSNFYAVEKDINTKDIGGNYAQTAGTDVGVYNVDVIRNKVSEKADATVWNFEKKDMTPYLRKNMHSPKYFYEGNGVSDYVILYSGVASEETVYMVNQFVNVFASMTGVTIETTTSGYSTYSVDTKLISVGITTFSNAYFQSVGYTNTADYTSNYDLGRDGFMIKTVDNSIFLLGNDVYALEELMSMMLGYEAYGVDSNGDIVYSVDENISDTSKILLSYYDFIDVPDIDSRSLGYYNLIRDNNENYRLAMRVEDINDDRTFIVSGHSQQDFMVSNENKKGNIDDNNAWFKRGATYSWQTNYNTYSFCWSNEEAVEGYVDYLFGVYAGEEARKNHSNFIVHMGMIDVRAACCVCDNCKNVRKAYGGETNVAKSAQQLAMANQVVEKFLAKLEASGYTKPAYSPEITFTVFAYFYAIEPPATYENGVWTPLVTPHKNIGFYFAPIDDDYSVSLTAEENSATKKNFEGWKAICSQNENILVWTYGTNFSSYFVNMNDFGAFQETYQYYADNGVTYLFNQCPCDTGSATFEELRIYLQSKLLWNTDRDMELLIDEFMSGYYGVAASGVRKYYNAITSMDLQGGIYADIDTSSIWTNNTLNTLAGYLDQAISDIETSSLSDTAKTEYKNRVYRLYCTIWYLQADLGYSTVGSYSKANAISNLKVYCEIYNIINYKEGGALTEKSWW